MCQGTSNVHPGAGGDSKLQVATCFVFQGLGLIAGRLLDTCLGGLGVGVGSFSSVLLLQIANTPRLS